LVISLLNRNKKNNALINTERISAWLQEPHHLQEIAPEAIQHLANEYPFFAPSHYFLLINGCLEAEKMPVLQQGHPVNPVLLSHLLRAASVVPEMEIVEVVAIQAEVLVTEDNTPHEQEEIIPLESVSKEPENEPEIADVFPIMQPVSSEDYFFQQGIKISNDIPDFTEIVQSEEDASEEEKEKALMVVMSFAEWLKYISSNSKKEKEEEADKKALKTMWQQQKLAAAIEEESEEIPEQVFEMAVNSIARKEELLSESLANVYAKQGKISKAIEMYQKLSLQNPEKNAYFATKIENLQKEI
jgi:tetratricopeptide (TPR) repeat protein